MEIFEVLFKGKKVEAVKTVDNGIYVKLPTRKAKNGHQVHESISKGSNGWKYSIIPINDFEHSFELWIRDDGKIACNGNNSGRIAVSKEPFNPDSPNVGKLNNIVTELYKTVEQLKAYEKRDIPASTIIKLRRIKLLSTLKLLGYSNIDDVESDIDDSKMYFSLSRISKQLEKYINIGAYVNVERNENGEDVIRLNIPDEMTRDVLLDTIEPVKEEYSEDIAFIKEEDEKREQKRSILPDYCAQPSKKMPQSDWLLYTRISRETANLLLELNADLINSKSGAEKTDLSQLTGLELADRISHLIDSKDFSKACEIEKRFLARESQRLIDKIKFLLEEMGEDGRKTFVAKALETIIHEESEFIKGTIETKPEKYEGMGIDD